MNIDNQYGISYTFSESLDGSGNSIGAYQKPDGTIVPVTSGGGDVEIPLHVTKVFTQETPVLPVRVGQTFTVIKDFGDTAFGGTYDWETLVVYCRSASITNEIVRFIPPSTYMNLWEVTLSGTVQNGPDPSTGMTVLRMDVELNEEINGATDRTISGRLVALVDSTTSIKNLRISAYGDAPQCPYAPLSTYTYLNIPFLVTASSAKAHYLEDDAGGLITTIYDYTITAEV